MRLKEKQRIFKSMLLISMLFFFVPVCILAQDVIRSHPLQTSSLDKPNVPDTLTLVAVRVEFQADQNRFTTGDGTFSEGNLSYLNNPEVKIDPLPHDRSYFEAHLQFAKNYFETVSGNQIHLQYRILPDIYQLPYQMDSYSPTGETFTNEKVAQLARDTWETVEQQGGFSTSDLDPQKTVFVIFHAGVGRDIELVGTNLDKTPQDIPSLFFNQDAFADLLNNSNFDGFDINGGSFQINNSLILPRTLSRPGEDVTGQEFVLQLSINGLLCASVGNYLGLPDLFNTQTGNSGIGRFGLMDGESFFSYQGLFPPEPSAWEKIYLGWQSPFTITSNRSNAISLPAASFHQNGSIAKYRLSSSEYFLVENRHRDPNESGVTLTVQQPDGSTTTQQFNNRDEAFVNQTEGFTDVLTKGVVTNVSNFDWSLPGGLDIGLDNTAGTSDDRLLNGGILIWHIDEAVIQDELGNRAVNANPQRRGVDLEEADGAQDIGRAATEDFNRQARGTAFDFWWDANDASVVTPDNDTLSFYQNRFGPDTHPSNHSNSGAPSFFEFYDFSDNQPVASFRIRSVSKNNIQPISLPLDSLPDRTTFTISKSDYFSSYPLALSTYSTQSDSFLIIPTQQSTYALGLQNSSNSLFDFQSDPPQQPYMGRNLIIGQTPTSSPIEITSWQWNGSDWNRIWKATANANQGFLNSLEDQTLLLDFTSQRIDIETGSMLSPLPIPVQRSASVSGHYTTLTQNHISLQPENATYSVSGDDRLFTGAVELTKNRSAFYLLTSDDLTIFEPDNFDQPKQIVQNTPIGWPAFADINDDGRMDFSYINRKTGELEARNLNGAILSYFPIQPPQGAFFIGTPLITSPEQPNTNNIFITAQDSLSINIYGYDTKGKKLEGFPLFVGEVSNPDNQPIHPTIERQTLSAVSHRGEVKAWKLNNIDEVLWGGRYGNNSNNKVTGRINSDTPQNPTTNQQILVKQETYNWPNPAEDFTNIRYQTNNQGNVDVKIITAGGTVVFEERFQASGGAPEEHRISTQNWSSGLYLGMITATVNGKKARKMIKIVVVH